MTKRSAPLHVQYGEVVSMPTRPNACRRSLTSAFFVFLGWLYADRMACATKFLE